MKHIDVKEIFNNPFYIGKTVTVCGWVRTSRDSKNISFLEINGIKIIANRDGKILVVLPEDSEKKIQYVVPMNNYFRQYLDTTLVERYFKLKSALNKTATKGFDPNG